MYNFIFVDDEDIIRDNLPYMIHWEDINFQCAGVFSSGEEALLYLRHHSVNLVLADIQMARMSGLELAKIINEEYPDTLIILISAHRKFEYAQEAFQYGVHSYLTKPTSYKDIYDAFKQVKQSLDTRCSDTNQTTSGSLIDKAVEYMREHLSDDISRNKVADYIQMNPDYFSKYFKKYTDIKFVDYLNRLRIEKAIALLYNPELKIYEICSAVGYKSMHHFLTLFKEQTGFSPQDYRHKVIFRKREEIE